jgi:hypothetical protein
LGLVLISISRKDRIEVESGQTPLKLSNSATTS